jgi:hypothetical protein
MNIEAVDKHQNLYLITDIFSQTLLDDFWKLDLNSLRYQSVLVEGKYSRRNIIEKNSTIAKLYSEGVSEISKYYKVVANSLWIDTAGYSMAPHLDNINHVKIGMQIYLSKLDNTQGTCFYNADGSLRYQFQYVPNTGYLMINSPDQWHGSVCSISPNSFRASCYFWLREYD